MNNEMVCVSGGFDPLHPGHLALFEEAASHGNLTVILNSDTWLIEKKGFRVFNWEDRATIVRAVKWVHAVEPVADRDRTVCEALRRLRPKYFAKSGDRGPDSMPQAELDTCRALGVEILYGICPHLPYSSTSLIAHAQSKNEVVWRKWGMYETYDAKSYPDSPAWKVKRLEISPGQQTSLQLHENRMEHFIVVRGRAKVEMGAHAHMLTTVTGLPQSYIPIPRGAWHRIINPDTALPLILIEVQTGRECSESDIIRFGEAIVEQEAVNLATLSHNLSDA